MRVLVVDDDPSINRALGLVFRAAGATKVDVATDPASAIPDGPPDLVVVDFNLGRTTALLSGPPLRRQWPKATFVILTAGILTEDETKQAEGIGYREVLQKPLTLEQAKELLGRYPVR